MRLSKKRPQRLMIVRHARSIANEALAVAVENDAESFDFPCSEAEAPIAQKGEEEISDLAFWLSQLPKEEQPTVAISSRYRRALQTNSKLVAQSGLPIKVLDPDERLNERCWGIFNLLTEKGIRRQFPKETAEWTAAGDFKYRPPEGESRYDVIKRLKPSIREIFANNQKQNLLIVTHSDIIVCLRKIFEGLTEDQAQEIHNSKRISNCSVLSYTFDQTRFVLEREHFVAPKR